MTDSMPDPIKSIEEQLDLLMIDIAYAARIEKVGTLDAEIKKFKTALTQAINNDMLKARRSEAIWWNTNWANSGLKMRRLAAINNAATQSQTEQGANK